MRRRRLPGRRLPTWADGLEDRILLTVQTHLDPPASGINSAARLASSVKEKQEISMVREKFSRVVSA